MNIDLFSYTNPGARDYNEDSFAVENGAKRFVSVLCDGLGGHNSGEVASNYAAKSIVKEIKELKNVAPENLFAIVQIVNDHLVKLQNIKPECKGMRTTVVGCVIENNQIRYFNSGDSRFYFFSNGTLKAGTKDHSVSQMSVDLGEMSYDDIRTDPNRNKLLKVLGETESQEVCTVYVPAPCQSGDAFLLCSDGFWEYVLEDEMEADLSKATTAKEWVEFMLVRLLLKFGKDNDNFTVVAGIVQ